MPIRAQRPCLRSGCPELTNTGYCDEHRKTREQHRGTAAQRGYDRAWQRIREQVLKRDNYLCRYCQLLSPPRVTPATEVDHVIKLTDAPQLRLDPANLLSTCHRCHVAKHERERSG